MDFLYFWYSVLALVLRTFIMAKIVADLHEESRKPLDVLHQIPRASWCMEVIHQKNEHVVVVI
jgi:hypothetical protein